MRLLLIPLLFIGLSAAVAFLLGDRYEIPGSFEEAVVWLRSFERWAWAVAMGVIVGDFLLPLPSTPALVCLGIIYGPLVGGLLGAIATTMAGLMAFGLTRALGRRGALALVGERDLARAQVFFDRWGIYAVALGRAIGGTEWRSSEFFYASCAPGEACGSGVDDFHFTPGNRRNVRGWVRLVF